jgi:hypothetical protein
MHGRDVSIEPVESPVGVEQVGAFSWRLTAAIGLVVGLIIIAIAKPWGTPTRAPAPHDGAPAAAGAGPGFRELAPPTPTSDPEIEAALGRALCNAPPQWRLVTMEYTAIGDSRTMYGAVPAEASGPADPSIPTAHLSAIRLYGIGLCSPDASGRPSLDKPLEGVTLWQIPRLGEPLRVDRVFILDQGLFRLGEAYFGPQPGELDPVLAAHVPRIWQPGRYVFQIDQSGDGSPSLWLALDFSTPVAGRPGG